MEQENLHTPFSKAVMAGLFTGIIATVVSMLYNTIYRQATYFELSSIINVATLVFAVPLLLLVAGFLYYAFSKLRSGAILYTIVMIVFTVLCIIWDFHIQRSADPVQTTEFRQLFLGIIIISGLASFFIPYLATHETNII
jgi:hypothetical protein